VLRSCKPGRVEWVTGFVRVFERLPHQTNPTMPAARGRFRYGGPSAYAYTRIGSERKE
jgi:hypothetical protein